MNFGFASVAFCSACMIIGQRGGNTMPTPPPLLAQNKLEYTSTDAVTTVPSYVRFKFKVLDKTLAYVLFSLDNSMEIKTTRVDAGQIYHNKT